MIVYNNYRLELIENINIIVILKRANITYTAWVINTYCSLTSAGGILCCLLISVILFANVFGVCGCTAADAVELPDPLVFALAPAPPLLA